MLQPRPSPLDRLQLQKEEGESSKPYGPQFKVAMLDQTSQVAPAQIHNKEACLEELEMLLEAYLALGMELLLTLNQQEGILAEEQQEVDYLVQVQELDLDLPLKEYKEEDCSLDNHPMGLHQEECREVEQVACHQMEVASLEHQEATLSHQDSHLAQEDHLEDHLEEEDHQEDHLEEEAHLETHQEVEEEALEVWQQDGPLEL